MPQVRIFQVDAFTRTAFTGNPAGVVLGADSLTDAQMQAIARELNNGDSAFVLEPDGPDHDLRVRFFTPRKEAGFAGHATVAAHTVLTTLHGPAHRRQKQNGGLVEVQADTTLVRIRQPPPLLREPFAAPHLAELLSALALNREDVDEHCTPMIAGAGSTRALVALRDTAALSRIQPDFQRLTALSAAAGAQGFLLFTLAPGVPGCDTEARMFCPALGIPEDPVSGNAHGMLGALLWQQRLLWPADSEGGVEFTGAQGHHMQRAGQVRVELELRAGSIVSATLCGSAVIVFETRVSL
jgi:PhzF family phenazine biosynthesis protein